MLAATVRVTRDLDLAEEALQDAYVKALSAWSTDGIPDVLLMHPAFGVFPCYVEPDGRGLRPDPINRLTDGVKIERGKVGEGLFSSQPQELDQEARADPAHPFDPERVLTVDGGDQPRQLGEIEPGGEIGVSEPIPPARQPPMLGL